MIQSSAESRVFSGWVRRLGKAETVGLRRSDAWRTDGQDLHTWRASASSTHAFPRVGRCWVRVGGLGPVKPIWA